MPPDPELVSALRAAVDRDPDSLPLRLHLAGMLLDLGAGAEALEQYAHVLSRDPANADALRGAQRAAEAAGDGARADGYRGLADVLSMWLGESERHLHELFETARRNAPCVLFFDEIDAIGQRRAQRRHSAGRNVVNQLLAEMDGVDRDNDGVFVLGATNHPWDVDAALLRPGRFDRMALVLPPDRPARAAILGHHLR